MCTLGTWPAGSVDASWLMICLFVRCSFEAFSEPISSASKNCLKQLEGITVCGVCLRYFYPPAFQLYLLQQLVQELAAQLDHHCGSWQLPFFEPTCLRQTPSFQGFLSQKLKPDVWKVVFNNTLKSKVFNTWTNASQKGVEPRN